MLAHMYDAFFVRHGESQSNAGEATSDPKDVLLTTRGREQARCVAQYFSRKHIPLKLILTSSYQRARETAKPTIRRFSSAFVEPPLPAVREFTYLSSMHNQITTIDDRRPKVEKYWRELLPFYKDAPDSESFAFFIERAKLFITRLNKENRGNIAIFSHEQFINAVLWLLDYQPRSISSQVMGNYRDYSEHHRIPNGAIIQLHIHSTQSYWTYERITSHLTECETGSFKSAFPKRLLGQSPINVASTLTP